LRFLGEAQRKFYKSVPASLISTVWKYGMPALPLLPIDLD
jgi:hypothetical protein